MNKSLLTINLVLPFVKLSLEGDNNELYLFLKFENNDHDKIIHIEVTNKKLLNPPIIIDNKKCNLEEK